MNKKQMLSLLIPSLILVSVTGCNSNVGDGLKETGSSIFISEYFCGDIYYDACLELSNKSNVDVSLNGYKINIYSKETIKYSIDLKETIKANGTFIYCNSRFDNSTNIGDLKNLEGDFLTGRNYIELLDSKSNLVDCIGTKGYDIVFAENESLVRLKEYFNGYNKYNYLEYVRVKSGIRTYLGNQDVPLTKAELMDGPKLTEEYSTLEFTNEKESPLGGYIEVTINSLGDGDTTVFNYSNSSNLKDLTQRTRYLMINTPEVDHGSSSTITEEKWGKTAEIYNNEKLNNAKHILVQSNKGFGLRETYGRLLGYVWYTNKENPSLSDYKLLNHELVIEGLARFDTRDKYKTMYTNDVLYYEYFNYAYNYALENKLKLYGDDVDPNFNK